MTAASPLRRMVLTGVFLLATATLEIAAQVPAARVDSIFAFASDTTPGCAVSAMRDGSVLFARGYGIADLEHDVPITPGTVFYMASVSKQFAAAAINLLVLDQKLSLDDDVRKYVTEVPVYQRPITIRHLMYHTSGLRDYLELFGMAGLGDFPITNADFLAMMARQRALNFAPGDAYSYSNSGYVLLSIIVERVSGKSLRAFAQERMFGPLGMTSTVFRDQHTMLIRNLATAYQRGAAGAWEIAVPYFDVVGDGGLMSTVEDLLKWETNWWRPTVGGAPWLALERERGRLVDGTLLTYGAGLDHGAYRGDSVVTHGGAFGGYNIQLMRFPARRFSVAVLCNSFAVPSSQLAQRVADVFLGDELGAAAPSATGAGTEGRSALDPGQLVSYTGTFFGPDQMLIRRLVADSGRLFYDRGPGNRSELIPVGGARFLMAGTSLVVTISAGKDSVRVESPGDRPIVLSRVSPGGRVNFAELAGVYYSSDLRASLTVEPGDSVLMVRLDRGPAFAVRPAFADAFIVESAIIQVVREAGQVTGLEASSGERARRVRFDRQP